MTRNRVLRLRHQGESAIVLLRLAPCGTVLGCGIPATNWHAWSPQQRHLATRLGAINAALRRGQSLAAQARWLADLLDLVEQLQEAEAQAIARPEERA